MFVDAHLRTHTHTHTPELGRVSWLANLLAYWLGPIWYSYHQQHMCASVCVCVCVCSCIWYIYFFFFQALTVSHQLTHGWSIAVRIKLFVWLTQKANAAVLVIESQFHITNQNIRNFISVSPKTSSPCLDSLSFGLCLSVCLSVCLCPCWIFFFLFVSLSVSDDGLAVQGQ